MSAHHELNAQLHGHRLATAEVIYYLPDHPQLLQSFIWQTLDVAPRFPRISKFLDHWRREIEAVIHSVQVAHAGDVKPMDWRAVEREYRLH